MNYDFTTLVTKAYGNNLHALGDGNFAIWSGDVNQDGIVESTDYSSVENSSQNFVFGYVNDDLTGDGIVESSDYSWLKTILNCSSSSPDLKHLNKLKAHMLNSAWSFFMIV